jgi:hypothetical protein
LGGSFTGDTDLGGSLRGEVGFGVSFTGSDCVTFS